MDARSTMSDDAFVISRVFKAPRALVWSAFSDCKHLKHWWGPKGFTMEVCDLDFRPGGIFHYGMKAPNGQMMWGKITYLEIVAPERLVHLVSFSDENRGVTRHPMAPLWPLETHVDATFTDQGKDTLITARWMPHNATDEERKIFSNAHDSMRQGWNGTMDQLDAHLAIQ